MVHQTADNFISSFSFNQVFHIFYTGQNPIPYGIKILSFFHVHERGNVMDEIISNIPLDKLKPFPNHPFKVREDDSMRETVESIKTYGVLVPAIARPLPDGNFELISGHRRKYACELAGKTKMPVIVRDLDRDAATIIMVDSNLQRENILPSERAAAYKMKMEALKHQGVRSDLTSSQHETKLRTDEKIALESGESRAQVQRYIRLTELQPELQQMVEEKKIALTPAVEISYLKPDEQRLLLDTIESDQAIPSLSQAQRMKKLSQSGELNDDIMLEILSEQKKPEKCDITLSGDILRKYFPRSYTPQRMRDTIIKLLENWQRKREQKHER